MTEKQLFKNLIIYLRQIITYLNWYIIFFFEIYLETNSLTKLLLMSIDVELGRASQVYSADNWHPLCT